jgi:YbbR domain-containing protein
VNVVFSGTGRELLRLGDQHYRVRKILEPGRPGPRRVILAAADVAGSENLQVKPVDVDPHVLAVTVDKVVSKRVPLRPLGELEPARGYEVDGPVRFEPSSVTLIGPRTILSRIDSLPVDLSLFRGSRGQIRRAVSLRIPEYPSVSIQPDSVQVLVEVRESEQAADRSRRGPS